MAQGILLFLLTVCCYSNVVDSKLPSTRDVEAVEYFLLPTLNKVSHFRVCFRFQLSSKCFHKNLTAYVSSKSQMLLSLLPLLASVFKVLPLPQKFNRFRFLIPAKQ